MQTVLNDELLVEMAVRHLEELRNTQHEFNANETLPTQSATRQRNKCVVVFVVSLLMVFGMLGLAYFNQDNYNVLILSSVLIVLNISLAIVAAVKFCCR